jgi:hypothetical protein
MKAQIVVFILFSTTLLFAKEKKLIICMEDSQWYPYIFTSEKNEPKGIQVDLIKGTLKSLDLEYDLDISPWKRCLHYANTMPTLVRLMHL